MDQLDVFIERHVLLVLEESGFRFFGRKFALSSPERHTVLIEFEPHDSGSRAGFRVTSYNIPAAILEYHGYKSDGPPASEWAISHIPLVVPEPMRAEPHHFSLWSFAPDQLDEYGREFEALLRNDAVPKWKGAFALSYPVGAPITSRLLYGIDTGDSAEMAGLIDRVQERSPDDPELARLLTWLRQRLESRGTI